MVKCEVILFVFSSGVLSSGVLSSAVLSSAVLSSAVLSSAPLGELRAALRAKSRRADINNRSFNAWIHVHLAML